MNILISFSSVNIKDKMAVRYLIYRSVYVIDRPLPSNDLVAPPCMQIMKVGFLADPLKVYPRSFARGCLIVKMLIYVTFHHIQVLSVLSYDIIM